MSLPSQSGESSMTMARQSVKSWTIRLLSARFNQAGRLYVGILTSQTDIVEESIGLADGTITESHYQIFHQFNCCVLIRGLGYKYLQLSWTTAFPIHAKPPDS